MLSRRVLASKLNNLNNTIKSEKKKQNRRYLRRASICDNLYSKTKDKSYLRRALKDYTKFIKLNPNFVDAIYNRSCVYNSLGEHENEIKDLTNLINFWIHPNLKYWYYSRGVAYTMTGKLIESRKDLFKALELDPEDIKEFITNQKIYMKIGDSYFKGGEYKQCLKNYKKSLHLLNNKFDSFLYLSLGCVYRELEEFKNAKDNYNKFIKFNRKNPDAYYNMAILEYDQKDYEMSISYYLQALEFSSSLNNSDIYFSLGKCYEKLDKIQEAINYYTKVDNKEFYQRAHKRLGFIFKKTNKTQKALIHLKIAVSLDKDYETKFDLIIKELVDIVKNKEDINELSFKYSKRNVPLKLGKKKYKKNRKRKRETRYSKAGPDLKKQKTT